MSSQLVKRKVGEEGESVEPKRAVHTAHPLAKHADELRTRGYTVIENVVSADRCAKYREGIRAHLLSANIDVDDPQRSASSYSQHRIVQHYEVGHCDAVWQVRQEEAVAAVFAALRGTNDLLVSFDGVCVMPPHHRDDGKRWWHTDQSHSRRGLRCIQGYVNLTSSHDERSGSLAVIPGSHLQHSRFGFEHLGRKNPGDDWYVYSDADIEAFGGAPTRVHGGVGSLVLWDSRVAHMAMAPPKDAGEARERCVVYVCMEDRDLLTPGTEKRKQRHFDEYAMTSHWAASKVIKFPKRWLRGKPDTTCAPLRTRVETPRMLELAGKTKLTTRPLVRTTPLLNFVKD
jgi:ectoine hydroxylase-related dioxygenase (phytanoyl-CoA dioxygenase family)